MDNEMVIDNHASTHNKDARETRPKEILNNTVDYDVAQDDSDGIDEMTYKEAQQHDIRKWVEASTCTSSRPCKTVINKTKQSKHLHFNPEWTSPETTLDFRMWLAKYTSTYTTPNGRRMTRYHNDTDCESDWDDCLDSDWGSEDSAYSDGVSSDASLSYSDASSNFGSSFDFEADDILTPCQKKHDHEGMSTEMIDALHGIEDDVRACVEKHFASVTDTARKAVDSTLPYITGGLHWKAGRLGVDPERVRSCLELFTKRYVKDVMAGQLEAFRQRIVDEIDAAVEREVLNSYEAQQECLKFAAETLIEEKEEEQKREQWYSEHLPTVHSVSTVSATAQPSLKRSFNQMVDDDMEVDEGDEADTEAEPVTKRMKKLRIHDEKELVQDHPADAAQQASTSREARREVRREIYERSTPSETVPKHTESHSRRTWCDHNDPSYSYNRERALSACSSRQVYMCE